MAFTKRDVKDRVVQYPRRYQLVEVQSGIFDLIPVTGTVTEPGTAINKAYLQPIEDNLENALEKTGEGKDVIVTFTEAATEAHIVSGEKLSVLFGKILKKFKNVAPSKHDSTASTYGLGTTANYGHVKTINGLAQASHIDGTALSAYQGKVLNDKMKNYILETIATSGNWTVPEGVTRLDILTINGGSGGGGGGAGYKPSSGNDYGGSGGDGGDGGAIKFGSIPVTSGTVFNIVIGAGGAGNSGNSSNYDSTPPVSGGETTIAQLNSLLLITLGVSGGLGGYRKANTSPTEAGNSGESKTIFLNQLLTAGSSGAGGGGGGTSGSYKTGANGGTGGTGAGNGGKGGNYPALLGESGANATAYGCGGGGSGGCASPSVAGTISNASSKGGNGRQGVVYIGYYKY